MKLRIENTGAWWRVAFVGGGGGGPSFTIAVGRTREQVTERAAVVLTLALAAVEEQPPTWDIAEIEGL